MSDDQSGLTPSEIAARRAPHAAGALEDAYGNRARVRCSRDDFAEGWMAALAWLHSRSSFRPGEWERQAYGALLLAMHEPSCLCVANWDGPPCVRACEPLDRRALLRELLGGRR